MKTQNQSILAYLKSGNSITALDAFVLFRCMRLAARILDLKDQGNDIESTLVDVGGKRVARYFLKANK